jgi:hypothetical protein
MEFLVAAGRPEARLRMVSNPVAIFITESNIVVIHITVVDGPRWKCAQRNRPQEGLAGINPARSPDRS